jgi:DNA-binding CsgD family transcriptional regulator
MAVVIDSGNIPSAVGRTGKSLQTVISKWQHKVSIGFNVSAEWLLTILREVDEFEIWRAWGSPSRDAFIADVLMLNFDLVESAIPEIIHRLHAGESFDLQKADGSKTRVMSKSEEIIDRQTKAKQLREEGKTQREIAEELGVDQKTISRDLGKNTVITEKMPKEPRKVIGYRITQYTKPETAARRIRDIFGDEFANDLAGCLMA